MLQNFFNGLEEVFSRLVSFVITTVFFIVFISAKPEQSLTLNWSQLLSILSIFWFVYEALGYVLFSLVKYFNKEKDPVSEELETPLN